MVYRQLKNIGKTPQDQLPHKLSSGVTYNNLLIVGEFGEWEGDGLGGTQTATVPKGVPLVRRSFWYWFVSRVKVLYSPEIT